MTDDQRWSAARRVGQVPSHSSLAARGRHRSCARHTAVTRLSRLRESQTASTAFRDKGTLPFQDVPSVCRSCAHGSADCSPSPNWRALVQPGRRPAEVSLRLRCDRTWRVHSEMALSSSPWRALRPSDVDRTGAFARSGRPMIPARDFHSSRVRTHRANQLSSPYEG